MPETLRPPPRETSSQASETDEQARILALQRMVGNRAVAALLGDRQPSAGVGATLQRNGGWWSSMTKSLGGAMDATSATATMTAYSMTGSAELPGKLRSVSDTDFARWLDALPASLKQMAGFTRVLLALSHERLQPHLPSVLTSGQFSWISSGADAALVYNVLDHLGADQVNQLIDRLHDTGGLARLIKASKVEHLDSHVRPWIAKMPKGEALSEKQRAHLWTIFSSARDDQMATLTDCINHRFDLTVGAATTATGEGETPIDWEAGGLRRMWPVLERLPVNHVAKNKKLISMGRYVKEESAEGYYQLAGREGAIAYAPGTLGAKNESADRNDPLYGVNRFDKVVRHEVGHAVEAEMGWADGKEPEKISRGGWKQYSLNTYGCAWDMIESSNGAILKLPEERRIEIAAVLATSMSSRTTATIENDMRGISWFGGLPAEERMAILGDKVFAALKVAVNDPWYEAPDGGVALGDYIYEESAPSQWNRYHKVARGWKVSTYQFRAPSEWFAEAYAAYYEPDPRGKGAKLADRDESTKRYFDTAVDTRAGTR